MCSNRSDRIQILSTGASLSYSSPTRSMATEFRHESFAQEQDSVHKRTEETLAKLIAAVTGTRVKEPPDLVVTPSRSWSLPPSLTQAPPGIAPAALHHLEMGLLIVDGGSIYYFLTSIVVEAFPLFVKINTFFTYFTFSSFIVSSSLYIFYFLLYYSFTQLTYTIFLKSRIEKKRFHCYGTGKLLDIYQLKFGRLGVLFNLF